MTAGWDDALARYIESPLMTAKSDDGSSLKYSTLPLVCGR